MSLPGKIAMGTAPPCPSHKDLGNQGSQVVASLHPQFDILGQFFGKVCRGL